jgi:asparagine synthase (glutamine-hydrolysing)
MVATMNHEAFYVSGVYSASEMGIYAGWVAHENSFAADQVFLNEQRDIALILSGECFVGPETITALRSKRHHIEGGRAAWLVHLYEEEGDAFFEKLNGLFSGLLIDKRSRKAFLFNDRYGMERIYWHEVGGEFYFASEAKALLRVLANLRRFDSDGVAQFLAFGCTTGSRTLFRGVELLPGASLWTFDAGHCHKGKYFSPESWEQQPALAPEAFESRFQETFKRILPRYFESESKIGISLTAGLDCRMIMAGLPQTSQRPVCYTFGGETGETLDVRLARRVAEVCGLEHWTLRIGPDFFSNFADLADRTVYVTDGCFGICGAHEIYMNRQARSLASIRLTGNYGSEVLRGISTFKPIGLSAALVNPEFHRPVKACIREFAARQTHAVTFAAFREIPWNLFGSLAAGCSQTRFRSPYLDNEIVALAYQASESERKSQLPGLRFVRNNRVELGRISTDKGYVSGASGPMEMMRRGFSRVTFKLDYFYNEGLPRWLCPLDPVFRPLSTALGLIGLHKHLHYRSWFRRELADYIMGRLADAQTRRSQFWDSDFVRIIGGEHLRGRRNFVNEINTVLTLNAIERLLFRDHIPNFVQDAAFTSENIAGVIGRQTKDSSFAT